MTPNNIKLLQPLYQNLSLFHWQRAYARSSRILPTTKKCSLKDAKWSSTRTSPSSCSANTATDIRFQLLSSIKHRQTSKNKMFHRLSFWNITRPSKICQACSQRHRSTNSSTSTRSRRTGKWECWEAKTSCHHLVLMWAWFRNLILLRSIISKRTKRHSKTSSFTNVCTSAATLLLYFLAFPSFMIIWELIHRRNRLCARLGAEKLFRR